MSFSLYEKNGLTVLHSDLLSDLPHGFSTRLGGVSPAPWDSLNLGVGRGDQIENVQENFRRYCEVLGTNSRRVVLSKQVHEANVRLVTEEDCGKGLWSERDYSSVDAMITNTPNIPLVVFSADCNVILFYDEKHQAIGAAHAGWRGTALGIVRNTVEEMHRHFGSEYQDLRAVIGPAIRQCCFETDADVPTALRNALGTAVDPFMSYNGIKWHIDLQQINALWLEQCGLTKIDICPYCTACRQDLFWSHRKVGNARGAQIAMISLEEKNA